MLVHFQFPSYGRPDMFRRALTALHGALTQNGDWRVQVVIESDDHTMIDPQMLSWIAMHPQTTAAVGSWGTKTSAVHAGLDDARWDLYFPWCDDLTPMVPAIDNAIRREFRQAVPKGLDGVVYGPDGSESSAAVATHPAIGRAYFDRFGYIVHPDYQGLCGDLELTDVSRALGKLHRTETQFVRHEHFTAGAEFDATYRRWWALEEVDRQTYAERKAAGFPREGAQ
jgi:hypothetical protein